MNWISPSKIRLLLISLAFAGGCVVLLARLWTFQIQNQEQYVERIPGASTVTVRVPPVRGRILDRDGRVLVDNAISYEASFDLGRIVETYRENNETLPKFSYEVRSRSSVRTRLNEEADIVAIFKELVVPRLDSLDLLSDFNAGRMRTHYHTHRGLIPFVYRDNLEYDEFARFAENTGAIPGLSVRYRALRRLPYGAMAGHLIGYVKQPESGELPEDERSLYQHYLPDDIGVTGIELGMEKYLRGQAGRRTLRRHDRGRGLEEVEFEPPTRGADVALTLDAEFQMAAEMAMRQIGRGAAVVLDARNGDVLAMASVPSYDPSHFVPRISAAQWRAYTEDPTDPLVCAALGAYEPGSTYKIVSALGGALAHRENDRFVCRGGVTYGNHFKKCWIHDKGGSHGSLDLIESIQRSCNAYFYLLGNAIGGKPMTKAAELTGFGRLSGLELSGEDPGIVMGGRFWREVIRREPNRSMTSAEVANMVIGQGETKASPLQITVMSAAVGNGGKVLRPRLVRKVTAPDGAILFPGPGDTRAHPDDPEIVADLIAEGVSPQAIEAIKEGMFRAVNVAGGTAGAAKIDGASLCGKTGSAQTSIRGQRGTHAWFTGFAPRENPRYAICVVVLGGKAGGRVAAPLARRIMEDIYEIERDRLVPGSGFRPQMAALAPARGHFDAIEEVTLAARDETTVIRETAAAVFPAAPEVRPARLIAPPPAATVADEPDDEGTVVRRARPVAPDEFSGSTQ